MFNPIKISAYMKRFQWIMLIAAACFFVACGSKQTDSTTEIKEVKVLTTAVKDVVFPLQAPVQLQGKQDIAIVPQVSATIDEVLVREGDRVVKDQPMFVLHQTAFQAAVDNASAGVACAEAALQTQILELDAKRQLLERNIISEHEYKVQDNRVAMARAQLAEAKAALKHATNDLSFTVIRAPHTGVVGPINYKQGALVSPQIPEPMTIVSDNSTVYAYMSISGDYYLYLLSVYGTKEQMIRQIPEASLILSDGSYYSHSGRLETISGIIDQSTGAISMRIGFPNPDGILAAGGNGKVEILYRDSAIVLPRSAVFSIQDKNYACVVEQDSAQSFCVRQTMVDVYRLSDTTFVVDGGLAAGQMVVVEGVKKLNNGETVQIVHSVK